MRGRPDPENDRWFLKLVRDKRLRVTKSGFVTNLETGNRIGHPVGNGYIRIIIRDGHKKRQMYVHRLVWIVHKGFIPAGFEINHIDGDEGNPRLSNLELVTRSQNNIHAFRFLGRTIKAVSGERNTRAKLTNRQARRIRSLYRQGWRQRDIAVKFDVSQKLVFNIVHKRAYPNA